MTVWENLRLFGALYGEGPRQTEVRGKEALTLTNLLPFKDRLAEAIRGLLPVIQLLIFGFAINTEVKHLSTAVLDQSLSPASRQLVVWREEPGRDERQASVQVIVDASDSITAG